MVKFADLIKMKKSGCAKCFSIIYALPCQIDRNLANYLKSFGKPVYPLKAVSFIRIDAGGGYHIEAKLNSKVIKFVMPKKLENTDPDKIIRKVEFEASLAKWMADKLHISIVTAEQGK